MSVKYGMTPNKEYWITEVITCAGKIKRAGAPPFLFTRIEERINKRVIELVRWPTISFILAGLALLLVLNLTILIQFHSKNVETESPSSSSYSLTTTDYNIY
ncbi:MAG: hypothetical protein U0T74_08455 [Chitinophagales bacterium]